MERELTCINCPMGCRLTVTMEEGSVTEVKGNQCARGDRYARQECVQPLRMVTAVAMPLNSKNPVSVKTASPIPKDKIMDCMDAIRAARIDVPVAAGDVIVKNVCGTGVDVIATKDVPD